MKKRKFGTRLFAGILSAVLIAGLMPASSLADVQGGVETEIQETQTQKMM